MHSTLDRTSELETGSGSEQQEAGRRRWLAAAGVVLAVLATGVTAAAMTADAEPRGAAVAQDAPGPRVPQPQAPVAQDPPQAPVPAEPAAEPPVAPADGPGTKAVVPGGTYGVQVLGEGWDAKGRYLVVDRGRLSDGPPAEPGVDGTRPVLFDTGAVVERRRLDLADAHDLRFSRSGGEPSYGPGGWDDLVTEVTGRSTPMLATVVVGDDGRLSSLAEPYRP